MRARETSRYEASSTASTGPTTTRLPYGLAGTRYPPVSYRSPDVINRELAPAHPLAVRPRRSSRRRSPTYRTCGCGWPDTCLALQPCRRAESTASSPTLSTRPNGLRREISDCHDDNHVASRFEIRSKFRKPEDQEGAKSQKNTLAAGRFSTPSRPDAHFVHFVTSKHSAHMSLGVLTNLVMATHSTERTHDRDRCACGQTTHGSDVGSKTAK